jgi:hypothetical protein
VTVRHRRRREPPALDGLVRDTLGNTLEKRSAGRRFRDRDGALARIERSCDAYPMLTRLYADGSYSLQKLEAAVVHIDRLTIEIIRRSDLPGFATLPRRWVVERTARGSTGAVALPRIERSPSHRPKPGWSLRQKGE